jgi:hypothetical protein
MSGFSALFSSTFLLAFRLDFLSLILDFSDSVQPHYSHMKLTIVFLLACFATACSATACCKVCRKGKPCGRTCISRHHICHKPTTCACTAAEAAYHQPAYQSAQPAHQSTQPAYQSAQPAYQSAQRSREPSYVDYANLVLNLLSYRK